MRGFRIGRMFGMEFRVDWTWVFIFALLTWSLLTGFTQLHPDWSARLTAATATAASLAFFVCILLHELAHALVARRYGIPVRSITLFLFGGVSNIEREPPSARAELLMAIVGPLASLVLGAVFLVLASLLAFPAAESASGLGSIARLGPLGTLVAWLGPVNVVVGVFNLIPAFPLDGGRVLRSLLWSTSGDVRAATRQASAIGQGVGWLFIAGGIAMTFGVSIPLFGTGLVSGLWLAFIGWFLRSAAAESSSRLALDETLAGMSVGQIMQRDGPVATPDVSVATLVHGHLLPTDDRALPVLQGDELVGLVSVANVRSIPPEAWGATPVSAIMIPARQLCVTAPDESLSKALEELTRWDIRQMPVIGQGKFVGMLRRHDIARWLELAWKPMEGSPGNSDVSNQRDRGTTPVRLDRRPSRSTRESAPPPTG